MIVRRMIIVDLDGTIYDSTQRSELIQTEKNWDAFHAASKDDEPNWDVVELLQALELQDEHLVFAAITGRNERYRQITLEWLYRHNVPIDSVWMRGDDDYRPDIDLKWDLLQSALYHHDLRIEDVWFALEDRDKVVDFWREKGINCYQVRMGTY